MATLVFKVLSGLWVSFMFLSLNFNLFTAFMKVLFNILVAKHIPYAAFYEQKNKQFDELEASSPHNPTGDATLLTAESHLSASYRS